MPELSLQERLAKYLSPSATLTTLVESLEGMWQNKQELGDSIKLMDLEKAWEGDVGDLPMGMLREHGKNQDEVDGRLDAIKGFVQEQLDTVVSAWDTEYTQALEQLPLLEEDLRGDVLYDWAVLASQMVQAGLNEGRWGNQEKAQWKRTRLGAFWNGLFRHTSPDALQSLPSGGAIKDWGFAMHALATRARSHEQLSPELHAWLDAMHQHGQHLEAWQFSSPRQVWLTENNHVLASDARPSAIKRDNHYALLTTGKPSAWTLWVSQADVPPPHPATRDWLGLVHRLAKNKGSIEEQAQALLEGLDWGDVKAWIAAAPSAHRPGGATWESLNTLAQEHQVEAGVQAMEAVIRAHEAPAPPDRPRRRFRS